ncbi:hypothetical protein D043_0153B, partial [Vibrio parahaemolyticus EKP-021]
LYRDGFWTGWYWGVKRPAY